MDSLTQIVLGGAVGAAIGGKKYGRKAVLIGAIAGTIPDTDTLLFIGSDPVTSFTYHRGFSHSFLLAILGTPILAWIFSKIKWFGVNFRDKTIHWLILLTLVTHMLLDAATIYGTQLFWPLNTPPIGIGSVFIIDPLYTLPFLFTLLWFLVNKSKRVIITGLIISSLYLAWGFAAQSYVTSVYITQKHIEAQNVLVQTTPFNSFLWRILLIKDNSYEVGYLSVFDKDKNIKFKSYPSNPALIEPIKDSFAVSRLQWFTKGFYAVKKVDNQIIMTDLRMGLEPDNYVFGFVVGEKENGEIKEIENKRYSTSRDMSDLSKIWQRIWNENIEL